ncbi:MAG: metalloregulator ArsR/SmtB family transcription factor [Clostridia bacterium]|nr:metalloregulator ArsR/SmtB family transcription factor [Clostridia bacterium]
MPYNENEEKILDKTAIFKCLADGSRQLIVAGLMKEPMYVELISERLALSPSTVSYHLKMLEASGLVSSKKEQYYTIYSLNKELFDKTLKELICPDDMQISAEHQRELEYRNKVLKSFMEYGKLKSIPTQRKKRLIILEEIASHFEIGRKYSEKEVNLIIADIHDDFCTIRREMICCGIMVRDHGVYERVK